MACALPACSQSSNGWAGDVVWGKAMHPICSCGRVFPIIMTRPRPQGRARHAWVGMWTKLWLNLGAEGGDPQIASEQNMYKNYPPQGKLALSPGSLKTKGKFGKKGKALAFHRSHRSPRVYWAWLKLHPVRSRRKEFSPPETLGGGRETDHSFRKPQVGKVV